MGNFSVVQIAMPDVTRGMNAAARILDDRLHPLIGSQVDVNCVPGRRIGPRFVDFGEDLTPRPVLDFLEFPRSSMREDAVHPARHAVDPASDLSRGHLLSRAGFSSRTAPRTRPPEARPHRPTPGAAPAVSGSVSATTGLWTVRSTIVTSGAIKVIPTKMGSCAIWPTARSRARSPGAEGNPCPRARQSHCLLAGQPGAEALVQFVLIVDPERPVVSKRTIHVARAGRHVGHHVDPCDYMGRHQWHG